MLSSPLAPSAISAGTRRLYRLSGEGFAWMTGIGMLIIYLLLANRFDASDGVIYAISVKNGNNLFHPHHVLYSFFCFAVQSALGIFHSFEPLRVMTTLSSIITAATVALLCAILHALTGRPLLSALCALAYAFTYGTFYLGTTSEVYPFSILCALGALWLCIRTEQWREPTVIAVALLSSLAVLFHQTGLFFGIAMAYFLARRCGLWTMIRFTLYSAFATGLPYLSGAYVWGCRSPAQFLNWIFFYVHTEQYRTGQWGHGFSFARLGSIVWGFISTLISLPHEKYLVIRPISVTALDVVTAVAVLILIAALAALGVALWRARRRGAGGTSDSHALLKQALWIWVGLQVLFTAWWDQTNPEFWYMMLPAAYTLIALTLQRLTAEDDRPPVALLVAVLSLAIVNVCGRVYSDSRAENSSTHGIINSLGCQNLRSGDYFLGPINDLDAFLQYACGQVVKVTSIAKLQTTATQDKAALLQHYSAQVFTPQTRVYLLETELDESLMRWYNPSEWDIAEVRRFYEPYLRNGTTVGQFSWLGRSWRIYQLAGPPAGEGGVGRLSE